MKEILLLFIINPIITTFNGCTLRSIKSSNYTQNDNVDKKSLALGDNPSDSQTKSQNSEDGKNELNSASNSKTNISELQKNGLEIIEDQSFWVNF